LKRDDRSEIKEGEYKNKIKREVMMETGRKHEGI
jgi:hypothetical protein